MLSDFLTWTVFGLATGGVYAVAASGLVVTYTTSGIFNFAHGAVGMLAAFTYWQLRIDFGWPAPIALAVVLLVLAPVAGALVERVIMRGLDNAPEVTRLVVPVGLMVGFIGLAQVLWKSEGRVFPRFFGDDATIDVPGDIVLTWHDIITMLVALAVAVSLTVFLKGTRTGISMRAVVDDRALARLNGARPDRSSMFSWAIGFSLAALAGVLIGPILFLNVFALTFLVINAYAAAMFGRLTSLPLTFIGGLVLGVLERWANGLLDPSTLSFLEGYDNWTTPLRGVIPIVLLFVILLVLPQEKARGHTITRIRERLPRPSWRSSLLAAAGLVVGVAVLTALISGDRTNLGHVSSALALGVILLSLVPLTGYGGQISLAQMGLAGIGAIVMAKWSIGGGAQDLLGLIAAFVIAGAVGAVIALPALRLRGVYLALATFAFAVFLQEVVFVQDFAFAGSSLRIERFELLGLSLDSDESYTVFLAVVFALCGLGIVALRRGPFGRRLQAMKDSPAACATLGIDLTRTKLQVFALSAGLAGLGGALLAGQKSTVAAVDFEPVQSLTVLLMAVAGGVGLVSGALVGSSLLASFDFWVQIVPDEVEGLVQNIILLAPGLIGISLGRNPNGLVSQLTGAIGNLRLSWQARRERRAETVAEPGAELETLGLDRPFDADDIELVDQRLDIEAVTSRWAAQREEVVS